MLTCAERFIKNLESKNLNFDSHVDSDGDVVVEFPYAGKTTRMFFSGDDGSYLSIYLVFERIPAEKKTDLILLCNKYNSQYKWVTFYVDDDNDMVLHDDAILSPESAADEAFELLVRMVKIADEKKPDIMKAIYV